MRVISTKVNARKLQIVSDLHLEFLSLNQVEELANKISDGSPADVLILAGDICSWNNNSFYNRKLFLDILSNRYSYVFYIFGNHEYYGTSYSDVQKLKSYYNLTNIIILDNDSYTVDDVTFYGTTLWFEETVEAGLLRPYLNDYKCIKDFTPDIWCREAIQFIKSIPDDEGRKVLITHHVPHSRFISDRYIGDKMNCFYLNEIGKYLNKFDLVTFGHSHESVNYQFSNRCHAISNPRGYIDVSTNEGSNNKFQYQLVVDV